MVDGGGLHVYDWSAIGCAGVLGAVEFYSPAEWVTGVLRRIARSADFQLRFVGTDRNICQLYGLTAAYEADDVQMALYQWGRYYHSVYDIPPHERPDDKTINDDAALDRWLEAYQRNIIRQLSHAASRRPAPSDEDRHRMIPQWRPPN